MSNLIAETSAGPLVPQRDTSTSSKEAALKSALFEMREAIDRYYADNGRYPKDLKTLAIQIGEQVGTIYSARNASSGLSLDARRAGSQHAIRAMPSRRIVVAPKTVGSCALTP